MLSYYSFRFLVNLFTVYLSISYDLVVTFKFSYNDSIWCFSYSTVVYNINTFSLFYSSFLITSSFCFISCFTNSRSSLDFLYSSWRVYYDFFSYYYLWANARVSYYFESLVFFSYFLKLDRVSSFAYKDYLV